MATVDQKKSLRQILRARREEISDSRIRECSEKIVRRIAEAPQFTGADLVLLYAPIGKELNLLPLVRIARERKIPVAFPVSDPDTCTLKFYLLEPDQRLLPGAYGIPEPPKSAPVAHPTEKTLCILPGLSFSPSGDRIGYGKGYYDRFLATFPGTTVGAVCEALLCKEIPTDTHDLPVAYVFTERGMIQCAKRTPKTVQKKPSVRLAIWNKLHTVRNKRASDQRPQSTEATTVRPLHLPPTLVLCTLLLLLGAQLIEAKFLDRTNETVGVVILQILVFAVPAILYSALRGERFPTRIRLTLPHPGHLWFCACILVVMITGSLLTCILTGGIRSLTSGFVLYNTFTAQSSGSFASIAALVISYALVPAFCEELVFRAYLCAEYERYGVGVSIAASAIFFAMLHFSLPLLLTYLFLGALLAATLYATRSFFAVFVLHVLYNLFCLFGQPYLSTFYVTAGSNDIFLFCVGTLFLLFAAFAAGEARKIYHVYARKNLSSDYTVPTPVKALPKMTLRAMLSPVTGACIAVWLIISVINLL